MKYANITEIRNGYIDLDLLKNENIKNYIGCVFLNASGAPFAFGYLNKSSESVGEICVAQQSKSTITSKVVINQNLFDNEHKRVTNNTASHIKCTCIVKLLVNKSLSYIIIRPPKLWMKKIHFYYS